MSILFVYQGPRNTSLEDALRRDLGAAFGEVRQTAAHSGEGGMTTVTLEIADDRRAQDAAEWLRSRPEVTDAAVGSFGEHA